MTTQRDAFDERLTRLESEVVDVKTDVADIKSLVGESATLQAQMLSMLDQVRRRTEDIARHLGVPDAMGPARRSYRVKRCQSVELHLSVPRSQLAIPRLTIPRSVKQPI